MRYSRMATRAGPGSKAEAWRHYVQHASRPADDDNSGTIVIPSTSPSSAKWASREARKAKRSLRRRIKLEQHPCGDRIEGPGPLFDHQSCRVPKLPRGGDGLADVSLRPSLAPQQSSATHRVGSSAGQPRRPSTSAAHGYRGEETPRFGVESRPRSRSVSAPPVTETGCREGHESNQSQQGDINISNDEDKDDGGVESLLLPSESQGESQSSPEAVDRLMTPIPPSQEKKKRSRGQSLGECQRLIRDPLSSGKSGIPELQQEQPLVDYIEGSHEMMPQHHQGKREDLSPVERRGQSDFSIGTLLSSTSKGANVSDETRLDLAEKYMCYGESHKLSSPTTALTVDRGREARVMLSSTVPLSPRSRCRTPVLPTVRHRSQVDGDYSPRRGSHAAVRTIRRPSPDIHFGGQWLFDGNRGHWEQEVKVVTKVLLRHSRSFGLR